MRALRPSLVVATLTAALAGCGGAPAANPACPDTAASAVARAWDAYRAQDYPAGVRAADDALALCPAHVGGLTVLGYNRMQQDQLDRARGRFDAVLGRDSMVLDAVIGRGLVAWREGDLAAAHRFFSRVLAIEPGNELAAGYLARIPEGFGSASRPPLVVPDTVVYPARARAGRFEVRTPDGWRPFHVNGMNLGAAVPGRHPSEFPDSATYANWIAGMAAMNVNAIRVYTIHPPDFYEALWSYNVEHPTDPLWLIHGVWTELPPEHDFRDPDWYGEFQAEMERVVDLLHGRADIEPRPGHASGHYKTDVSPWTLAYIIGREWEPFAVEEYNEMRERETSFDGTYLTARGATPTDVWMADALEHLVGYEMARYNAQRPVAYTNWPTLDPLEHPTEATVEEEVAIREALGERIDQAPVEYDNDAVSLDATLIRATDRLPAGTFASFHAYPYYPDFMVLQDDYATARSPWGASSYFGYLTALREHHGDIPILIAEYGVPAGRGSAHMQPQGWHHGGLSEARMAAIDARMTREIAAAGLAGGAMFAWIDEWFKKNWMVIEFELPADRNRLWLNRLDAEQHYGMLAMEPAARLPGRTLEERLPAWADVATIYTDAGGTRIRAVADEAHLWLLLEGPGVAADGSATIGFDVVDPAAGETAWPVMADGGTDPAIGAGSPAPSPVGLEFALTIHGDSLRLLGHAPYVPWRIVPVGQRLPGEPEPPPYITDPLPGLFHGRWEQRRNRPYQPVEAGSDDAGWSPLYVVTNRRRFTRDSTEIAAYGYDRGILRRGEPPDGDWTRSADGRALEVRIPWGLLNVTDPSQRRVLYERKRFLRRLPEVFGTTTVEGIRITASVDGRTGDPGVFTWATWDEPTWRVRRRPVFDSLRAVFTELEDGGVR